MLLNSFQSLVLVASAALLTSCAMVETSRVVYPDTPVAYQFVSEVIDEDTIEHTVKFRNVGREIISFDYTITDDPTVPHIDCLGPNSGLVENLYPGAEVAVKNGVVPDHVTGVVPAASKSKSSHVVLGRISHGKRSSEDLARSYKPSTLKEDAVDDDVGGALLGGS